MAEPFKIIPVEPIGTKRSTALVYDSRSGASIPCDVDVPVYPPSSRGERLRQVRISPSKSGYFSVATAAIILGIRSWELEAVEVGALALESDAEWDLAEKLLRDTATKGQIR